MHWFKILVVILISVYLLVLIFLYFSQMSIVYVPDLLEKDYKYSFDTSFEEGFEQLANGKDINYLFFKNPSSLKHMIYFHGNGGALDNWGHIGAEIGKHLGINVWIFDYPGYGKSSGPLANSSKELVAIGDLFVKKVEKEFAGAEIYLHGRSLGSGVAAEVSLNHNVAGLSLETPYTSTVDMARQMFFFIPSFLVKVNLNNRRLIGSSLDKIMVFHGQQDTLIHYSHSIKLKGVLGDKMELITIPEGTHHNLPMFETFWENLAGYIKITHNVK